jgi:hypothetical protein
MGRLIPAGTGMKFYRNVKIDVDPTVNQKEADEFDEYDQLRGGIIPAPADIPLVEPDTDEVEVDDDIELEDDFATEEEFDLDDDSLELADDDDDF